MKSPVDPLVSLSELIGTRVLNKVAGLDGSAVIWGQPVATRRSSRRSFPNVDFYGWRSMHSGLLGHHHVQSELGVVLGGRLNICIEKAVYEVVDGDWLVLTPWVLHGECCLPTRVAYKLFWLIMLPTNHLECQVTQYNRPGRYQLVCGRDIGPPPDELLEPWTRLMSPPWPSTERARCDLLAMLTFCLQRLCDDTAPPPDTRHPLVAEVKAILSRAPTDRLSVAQLASEVALSPNYLSTLFHRETGMTIRQFVDLSRVEASKPLLSDPRQSIKQVAHALGYASQQHFSRVFRRVTGMSPRQYRVAVHGI